MENKDIIGIVTVLYNSSKVLVDFFQSLEEQTYRDFVLYVVDNNSPDDSLQIANQLSKGVSFKSIILPQEENWGVAKGNNIGITKALADGCDYVLLSNNDVELKPNTIKNLYNGMLYANSDMAVPKIYYYGTNIIWAAGGKFTFLSRSTRHIGVREEDNGHYNNIHQVEYAPTCFMLIDKKVFSQIGFMDEDYFVYFDDTDFVYRATKLGRKKLMYIPNSILYHKESISTGKNSTFSIFYYCRNILYFNKKNRSVLSFLLALIVIMITLVISQINHYDKNSWKAAVRGIKAGIKISINGKKI